MGIRRGVAIGLAGAFIAGGLVSAHAASGVEPARIQPRTSSYPAVTYAVLNNGYVAVGDATGLAINSHDDAAYFSLFAAGNPYVTMGVFVNGNSYANDLNATGGTGSGLRGVAVDQNDDTVYVADYNRRYLYRYDSEPSRDDSRPIGPMASTKPYGVAVDSADDTVYFTVRGTDDTNLYSGTTLKLFNGRPSNPSLTTVGVGLQPFAVAVNEADDSVYVTNWDQASASPSIPGTVSVVNGRSAVRTDDTITVGIGPAAVAVNQADDSVYVTNAVSNTLSIINGRLGGARLADDTINVGSVPTGVAVDQADDTVYVVNAGSANVSVINGGTGVRTDDTITLGGTAGTLGAPWAIAVDDTGANAGLIYVAKGAQAEVAVIGRASTTAAPTSGAAGDAVTLTVAVPGFTSYMDNSTIQSVKVGGASATITRPNPQLHEWRMVVPPGTPGATVAIEVQYNGGLWASAGTFTYNGSPTPPVVYPPGAPTSVTAVAGISSATVSWQAPVYTGSYPITQYLVTSRPDGRTCIADAPTKSCVVEGLTSGRAYTFTVQALNGAGWGPASDPSASVTPTSPRAVLVLDKGTRTSAGKNDLIQATGTTVNVPEGTELTSYFKYSGDTSFTRGQAAITVQSDGTFSWTRQVKKDKTLVAYVTWKDATSNRVRWAPLS